MPDEMTVPDPPDSPSFLQRIVEAVGPDRDQIQAEIDKLRRDNPQATPRLVAEHYADRICWLYAGQGAATALPGTIPGLGTGTQLFAELTAGLADAAFLVRNQARLSMGVAAAYGHPLDHLARRDEFAVQLGLWCGAVEPAREAARRVGVKIAVAQFKKVPGKVFQRINRKIGTTVLTKYGTKRGGIAVGRLVPFGVGALVGGGFNLAAMKAFKKVAIHFYQTDLPNETVFEMA